MSAADKLRDLHADGTLTDDSEATRRYAARDEAFAALPDIIAVIAAAEQVRDGWMMWEDGADEAHMTGMIDGHLVDALAALNARLTDTSDGGAA